MMFNKIKLSALLMTLSFGSLVADFNPADGQWRVTGEYLYLQPTLDDTYFVIDSPVTTTFPNGTRKNNDFNFHSGYRVGGAYAFCDCDREVGVYYTHLNCKQNKTITGNNLWATVGRGFDLTSFENYAGTASSHLNLLYETIDALYFQQLTSCCGLDFSVVAGLEAAELRLNEGYTYVNGINTLYVHEHSKTRGIGPQIGFNLNYDLWDNCECGMPGKLSLNVFSSGSILASNNKTTTFESLNSVTDLDVSNKKTWRVIPAFHARVGLNYDMKFECVGLGIEVGYEFSSYLRALSRVDFPSETTATPSSGLSYNNFYNFDVQGLYVSGTLKF